MARGTVLRLVALIAVLTAIGSVVLVSIDWFGPQAADEAAPIDTLMDVMIVLSTLVFVVVMVMMGYALWRWRARPGDESDGAPIHGHTGAEITWTLIPTIIVLVGAVYSAVVLADIEERKPGFMVVKVTATQFAWSFEYPEADVTTTRLHVPAGRQVEFQLTSADVIHSFWVPEWRMKKDAVPGITTRITATPSKAGSYSLICTELCGVGHATMRARVVVQEEDEFESWLAEQGGGPANREEAPAATEGAPEATEELPGQRVFVAQGCGSCHTLEAVGTESGVGPNLDKTLAERDRDFIRRAIVDPEADIAEGFSGGIMPSDYGDRLNEEQVDNLVEFLATVTGGSS